MKFNGSDYVHKRDAPRLTKQYERVLDLMQDGRWRTLSMIARETGDPESSISAQLRHMRKERNGGHTVNKSRMQGGLYYYRLKIQGVQLALGKESF
jgi:hypothetical protein